MFPASCASIKTLKWVIGPCPLSLNFLSDSRMFMSVLICAVGDHQYRLSAVTRVLIPARLRRCGYQDAGYDGRGQCNGADGGIAIATLARGRWPGSAARRATSRR